jgi:6-phosphogluconolactonase
VHAKIHILEDKVAIGLAIAEQWLSLSNTAIAQRGSVHIALSGGSTPRILHQTLASSHYASRIDWQATHIYFGDERSVTQDHPDSNYRMAQETLLSKVDIPESNIHPIPIDVENIQATAERYAEVLRLNLPNDNNNNIPQFDLVLLGIGDDGHTASLFPNTSILDEQDKYVAEVFVEKMDTWRVSLTYPIINHARNVSIMVAGSGKAEIIAEILGENKGDSLYPVQRVKPIGQLDWYLDKAAAEKLSN